MGDLSGLLLCKQMKKAKRKKLFLQKSHRKQKPCYVMAFWNRKKVFPKNFAAFFVNGCKKRQCLV